MPILPNSALSICQSAQRIGSQSILPTALAAGEVSLVLTTPQSWESGCRAREEERDKIYPNKDLIGTLSGIYAVPDQALELIRNR